MLSSQGARIALACLALAAGSGLPAGAAGDSPGHRIVFLGNSITHHAPSTKVDWSGDWGMAASAADKDYVHVFADLMTERLGRRPEIFVKNVVSFERNLATCDIAALLEKALEFQPDLVVLAIGENVPRPKTDADRALLAEKTTQLLSLLRGRSNPTILVRSCFWANDAKDAALREACRNAGGIFVDISALCKDEANYARSEREYSHSGVARHPGDRGMRAIAEALYRALPAVKQPETH